MYQLYYSNAKKYCFILFIYISFLCLINFLYNIKYLTIKKFDFIKLENNIEMKKIGGSFFQSK